MSRTGIRVEIDVIYDREVDREEARTLAAVLVNAVPMKPAERLRFVRTVTVEHDPDPVIDPEMTVAEAWHVLGVGPA